MKNVYLFSLKVGKALIIKRTRQVRRENGKNDDVIIINIQETIQEELKYNRYK